MRELCRNCRQKPIAINYYKDGKPHYRTQCDNCSRKAPIRKPKWKKAGYKKKVKCERCGFSSKFQEQFEVYHVDRNLSNCRLDNLKTICVNCNALLTTQNVKWKQGDLTPDNL